MFSDRFTCSRGVFCKVVAAGGGHLRASQQVRGQILGSVVVDVPAGTFKGETEEGQRGALLKYEPPKCC